MSSDGSSISSEFLMKVRANHGESWFRLVVAYTPRIESLGLRAGVSSSDLPDLIQEIWRSVFSSLKNFRRDSTKDSFGGWLHRIVQCRIADYFESKSKRAFIEWKYLEQIPFYFDDQLEEETKEETREVIFIRDCLLKLQNELKPHHWNVFRMYVIENFPVEDVVETLGVQSHQVYLIKSRILKRLRNMLEVSE